MTTIMQQPPRERIVTLNELATHLRRIGWEAKTIELLLHRLPPIKRVLCGPEVLIVKGGE